MNESWSVRFCISKEWGNVKENFTRETNPAGYCPPVWDGFKCWGPTAAGETVSSGCPTFKGSDVSKFAFRTCGETGEWLDRDGAPTSLGWTNYTPCLTPEIREIMKRLGSDNDAQIKFEIAENTRILEFVGLSLSLSTLLLSLFIFYYFRTLRNTRTRLHRHLFIAMVIQVAIRLTVYTDQAIIRSLEERNANLSKPNLESNPIRRGIDNTPVLCEASYISLEYARTAMFMWMFVEGLFLHNMITVTVFEEKLSPLVYPVIGWIIPIPLTVAWAIVTHLHYGSATCWWGYNFTVYFWILEGPRLAVLMVNLAFLLNILRVLVTKLRQSNSSETQQAMKAVKAALVLLPLLGLTNLLNMLDAPLEKSPLQFALWSYSTHLLTSTQGFILAFLYCFRNGEVQNAIRKFVRLRVLGNSKQTILAKNPIPLSSLDNPSLFNGNSGGDSQNINQSQRTMTKISTRSVHISHHPNNHQVSQRQNARMPPLIVRSYSNGVLKQTTVKIDPHNHSRNHQLRTSSNCRTPTNENPYGDGRQPLLCKNYQCESSAPSLSIPMTSLSTREYYQKICNRSSICSGDTIMDVDGTHGSCRGIMQQTPPEQCYSPSSSRRSRTAKVSEWGRLIIPDFFRRQSSTEQQIDDVGLSSFRQKDVGCNVGIIEHNDHAICSDTEAEEENFSEDDEDDFVSVEMNQESSFGSPYHEICKVFNDESRCKTDGSTNGIDDFDDLEYDNEETVQISMEIPEK